MALTGYKTYIMAALIGGLAAGHALGYVDDAQFGWLSGLLGAGGLAALRNAIPTKP